MICGSIPVSSKQFLVMTFQLILWDCWRFYHWIEQKILCYFHVKHFEIGPVVRKLDIVKCKGERFESPTFQCFGRNILYDTLTLSKVVPLVLAVKSDLFSCLHHGIDPIVPKLDIVECKGQQFYSQTFQACFGRNILWVTLALSEVVPLVLPVNSKLFPWKTLWNWPNGSKVRHYQMQRSAVRVPNNFWS